MDTGSFEGVLQSLAATPPSAAIEALATAATAAPTIQAQEKADLENSFPQVERSSGLPRLEGKEAPTPNALDQGKPPELVEEKGREGKPPEVEHKGAQGPLPGKNYRRRCASRPRKKKEAGGIRFFRRSRHSLPRCRLATRRFYRRWSTPER